VCFIFLCCLQCVDNNVAALRLGELLQQSKQDSTTCSLTTALIREAIALLEPAHEVTADLFSQLAASVTRSADGAGCSMFMEAGGIAAIVGIITRWLPQQAGMSLFAFCSAALLDICRFGGPVARAILSGKNCQQLLEDIVSSSLGVDIVSGRNLAAEALAWLEIPEVGAFPSVCEFWLLCICVGHAADVPLYLCTC
jgi:hypothetical protein